MCQQADKGRPDAHANNPLSSVQTITTATCMPAWQDHRLYLVQKSMKERVATMRLLQGTNSSASLSSMAPTRRRRFRCRQRLQQPIGKEGVTNSQMESMHSCHCKLLYWHKCYTDLTTQVRRVDWNPVGRLRCIRHGMNTSNVKNTNNTQQQPHATTTTCNE